MLNKHLKFLRLFLLWTITISFFLVFAPFTHASQAELDQVNQAIHSKGAHWLAKETAISKMPQENRKMHLGLVRPEAPQSTGLSAPETSSSAVTLAAPASLDWRNVGGYSYVTPVRDQGNCGSCWAFATTAALESNGLIATGNGIDRSEQILVSCSPAGVSSGGCNGGYIDRASSYIRDTGLPPESYYPYTHTNGTCPTSSDWQNYTSRITSWHYVAGTTSPTIDQIKSELNTYGPLVTTMDVYADFYYYAGGIYKYTSGSYQGGHAVLIVGYDDAEQYFIVKNSWGSGWGESGYFKIAYSEMSSVVYFGDWTIAYYTDTTVPGIKVATPNGSESWAAGTTKTIQWSYTGNPGAYVKVDLYSNGVLSSTLSTSTPIGSGGTGSYSWNIPSAQTVGALYQIKVSSTSNAAYSDTSDNYFTINAPTAAAITLLSPNGGEQWKVNTSQKITWSYTGNPGTYLKIELLKGSTSVKTISSKAIVTTGYYNWKVPVKQLTGTDYRLKITSTSNSSYTDTSDSNFTISR